VILGLLCAAALAGCGSSDSVAELPPAAAPDASPELTERPAGEVVRLDGRAPEGVAVDPLTGLVAVAVRDPAEVLLVDGQAGRLRRRAALPAATRHLALAGTSGPLLAPAEDAGSVAQIQLPGGETGTLPAGAAPHDVAAAGGRQYVTDRRGGALLAIGGEPERVGVAAEPDGVAVADEGRTIAVVSGRERVLELFDTLSLERLGRAPAGAGPTHVVSGSEGRFYVVDTTGDALLVFETRPELRLTRRVALLGAPYGIAVDRERGRLWVTLTATNELVELSAGTRPRTLRSLPAVRQPNSVAVDPRTGRAYVTGRADDRLQLLDARRAR